jgi:hypothetical protein
MIGLKQNAGESVQLEERLMLKTLIFSPWNIMFHGFFDRPEHSFYGKTAIQARSGAIKIS